VLFQDSDERRLAAYQHDLKAIFAQFDEKVRSGVLASVSQILSPFQHPDLVDTFCADKAYRLEKVLDGKLYLVDMTLAVWGIAGKVVYTLIKLRFFNVMQHRALHQEWNQTRLLELQATGKIYDGLFYLRKILVFIKIGQNFGNLVGDSIFTCLLVFG